VWNVDEGTQNKKYMWKKEGNYEGNGRETKRNKRYKITEKEARQKGQLSVGPNKGQVTETESHISLEVFLHP
jgi:hypothetical protein